MNKKQKQTLRSQQARDLVLSSFIINSMHSILLRLKKNNNTIICQKMMINPPGGKFKWVLPCTAYSSVSISVSPYLSTLEKSKQFFCLGTNKNCIRYELWHFIANQATAQKLAQIEARLMVSCCRTKKEKIINDGGYKIVWSLRHN